ncbi:related to RIO2 protein [Serendipita indica DSM 11827]|uniref:Serine/threonine-protein kinase RIO2 n=1 Tax=Serendipita indica (strain DSM 11827) TaxID=1109443 RepID=G4U2L0_SERID|nr:related to RIO2 protein [Serendipita indica DSM 11827]
MKLDATDIRYLSSEEFRVLTAVEMGSKNHEVVPTSLITQISKLKSGGINKILGSLAKRGLVSRVQNAKYDGYRLTYGGYDFLAIRALSKRDSVTAVGNQIGVGKESDIYVVTNAEGEERVLKLHRLGRVSFRAIKSKRDYLGKRKSATWMYMSRLSAQKEWAFMKVLHENGFPVPKPLDQARHCVLMELIDAYPLRQISEHPSPGTLYSSLMDLIVRFAHAGLIHGDFNEFNILIHRVTGEPIVIDFPQMVSTRHANAEFYFNRDVECIKTFFLRRFGYQSLVWPRFSRIIKEGEKDEESFRLDVVVAASGFGRKDQEELEKYMEMQGGDDDRSQSESEEESDEDEHSEAVPLNDNDVVPESGSDKEQGVENASEQDSDDESRTSSSRSNLSERPRNSKKSKPKARQEADVKELVSSELAKQRSRQEKRYHSKRSAGKPGRTKGSKMKSDKKVRVNDGWD